MSNQFNVRVAEASEFLALREEWNALVASMRFATPFSTWEWVYTWWECFGSNDESLILLISRGLKLVGILPLSRRIPADALRRVLRVRKLELSGVHEVFPDHLDLIAAPVDASDSMRAALDFLVSSGIPWDVLRLPAISADSAVLSDLHKTRGRITVDQLPVTVAPYIAGPKRFDQLMSELSRNERYKLRSRSRKLLEGEGVAYTAFGRDERKQALAALLGLHAERAAQKGIDSSFARPHVQIFHEKLLDRLDWNQVLFRALRSKQDIIAIFYGFRLQERVFYFQLGHDPAWSKSSPGLVLITETIREALDGGCTEYNFLQGDEPFKRTWAQEARTLYDCYIYNDTVRGNMARRLLRLKGLVKTFSRGPVKVSAPKPLAAE